MRLEIRGSDVFIELGRAGETKIGEAEYAYTHVNFNINAIRNQFFLVQFYTLEFKIFE